MHALNERGAEALTPRTTIRNRVHPLMDVLPVLAEVVDGA